MLLLELGNDCTVHKNCSVLIRLHFISQIKFVDNDKSRNMLKFAELFDQCMRTGEQASLKDQQELNKLKTENKLLRRLLKISGDFNNINSATSKVVVHANNEQCTAPPDLVGKELEELDDDTSDNLANVTLVEADFSRSDVSKNTH